MKYLSIEEAIKTPGLRLVLTAGVPGPWGESAKAMLAFKGIPFSPVFQEAGGANEALQAWTGQNSAPVGVLDDLPPVSHWLDLLHLIERMQAEPPLLPDAPEERARAQGLSAMIAGVDGVGWNRRLQMLDAMLSLDEPPEMAARLGRKYGWSPTAAGQARSRLQSICSHLDEVLATQKAQGLDYFVGNAVSAVDFYWANFAAMFKPLPDAVNPMPAYLRATYESGDADTMKCLTPGLEAHRDMMYERHITLPLEF